MGAAYLGDPLRMFCCTGAATDAGLVEVPVEGSSFDTEHLVVEPLGLADLVGGELAADRSGLDHAAATAIR